MCVMVVNYLRKANDQSEGKQAALHSEYKVVFVLLPTVGENFLSVVGENILESINGNLQIKSTKNCKDLYELFK